MGRRYSYSFNVKLLSLSFYLIMIISFYFLMDLCHILIDSFVWELKFSSTQTLFSILFNHISCLKKDFQHYFQFSCFLAKISGNHTKPKQTTIEKVLVYRIKLLEGRCWHWVGRRMNTGGCCL